MLRPDPDLLRVTGALWTTYSDGLRRWLAARAGETDADDLLQEVFLRVHTRRDQLRDQERIAGWLHSIARNVLVDHLRRKRATDGLEEVAAPEPEDDRTLEIALAHWLATQVAELEPPYREALELTELGGLTQKAAAEQLGVSYSAMKSRVQRGRQQLAARLSACCRVELDARGNLLDLERREQCNDC